MASIRESLAARAVVTVADGKDNLVRVTLPNPSATSARNAELSSVNDRGTRILPGFAQ